MLRSARNRTNNASSAAPFLPLSIVTRGATVNGIAWLSTTPVVHPFILVEPVNAWRSPSEDTTINVPIVLESAVTTSTKITVKSTDGTAEPRKAVDSSQS